MRLATLLALILFAFAAIAGEGGQGIYVDLDKAVAAGKVEAVNGISSSGQPDQKSLKLFADSGYALVIDMRGPDEDRGMDDFQGAVEATGMQYLPFPVVGAESISFETAEKLDELLQNNEGPILIHCASGNRVGALLALRYSLSGANDEDAIAYGRNAGMTRHESRVREVLEAE
jgi:uncharacterized protein (TIGR01244 family)